MMVGTTVKFVALETIIHVKVFHFKGLQVKADEPQVGAEPDVIVIVWQNPVYHLIGQSFSHTKTPEGSGSWIKHI